MLINSSTEDRRRSILKLISDLDVSPTMFQNAVEKYTAIATFISENTSLQVDMYPQGSFACGTITRPYKKDKDPSYDLDFICEVQLDKNKINTTELRRIIRDALKSSEVYSSRMEECNECFTIHYADCGDSSFSIDIVPAVPEDDYKKSILRDKSTRKDLIDTSIAIAKQDRDWITNNPKGFKDWFYQINQPFLNANKETFRQILFERAKIFDKIEDIPAEMDRSPLQQVIQILKRHRDVHYSKLHVDKPISAIITTLTAEIAQGIDPFTDTFELLEIVLTELIKYSHQLEMNPILYEQRYGVPTLITHYNHQWELRNPANPEDNLTDSWNNDESDKNAAMFFNWIRTAKSDLIDSMSVGDAEFRAITESAFGPDTVKKSWGNKYQSAPAQPIESASKPWCKPDE